jgi:CheY-like chemotaxis protein
VIQCNVRDLTERKRADLGLEPALRWYTKRKAALVGLKARFHADPLGQRLEVVLMDIAMPGLNGLEAAARRAKEFPEVRIIILSMHNNEEYVVRALKAGAVGYLLKKAATAELENALHEGLRGEIYLSREARLHTKFPLRGINHSAVRLKGKWLQRAGFLPGQQVSLNIVGQGAIELRALIPSETPEQRAERLRVADALDRAGR